MGPSGMAASWAGKANNSTGGWIPHPVNSEVRGAAPLPGKHRKQRPLGAQGCSVSHNFPARAQACCECSTACKIHQEKSPSLRAAVVLSKWQPTPSASASSATPAVWPWATQPRQASHSTGLYLGPCSDDAVRPQVQRFHLHSFCSAHFHGDTESHLSDPTHPSFHPSVPIIHLTGSPALSLCLALC